MAHTQGPWKIVRTNSGLFIKAEHEAGYFVSVHGACRQGVEDAEDNARLIAAAPDLLAACEQARIALTFYREWMAQARPIGEEVAHDFSYPFGIGVENFLRDLIAKAKGA